VALGAATIFTDATLISATEDPSGITVTSVKSQHLTELRTAVNAVRSLAGLPAATWTYSVTPGQLIHVDDVRELRAGLQVALSALQISLPAYTDPNIKGFLEDPPNATAIKAAHIRELRQAATTGTGASGGSGGGTVFSINWLITDQLGTPRIVVDESGSLAGTRRFDYLPFGGELNGAQGLRGSVAGYASSNADRIRQKFTQKEHDGETGLDYFGSRYYSSDMGRFTSPDSFVGLLITLKR
jgi:RHS repeat-associated protein